MQNEFAALNWLVSIGSDIAVIGIVVCLSWAIVDWLYDRTK